MSLYNLSFMENTDPVLIMRGLNDISNGSAFTLISFAIGLALFIGIYQSNNSNLNEAMAFSGILMAMSTAFLAFIAVVPVWVPFVWLSILVVSIFIEGSNDG